jgi:hypothetical protein
VKPKLLVFVLLLPSAVAQELSAQAPDTSLARLYQLDLAVPEAPAAVLVDVQDSDLLRPGSLQTLGLSFKGFSGEDGGFRLPKSYGLEVAPYLLRRNFSLAAYRQRPQLSRMRLSIATRRGEGEGSATALSFGARTSLVNRADLRTDTAYENRIRPLLDTIGDLSDAIRFAPLTQCPDNDIPCLTKPAPDPPPGDSARAAERIQRLKQRRGDLIARVDAIRDSVVANRWNAPVFDVAYASGLLAADSTGRDPSPTAHVLWASWAFPVSTWGQLMLGARGGYEEEGTSGAWETTLRGGARLYAGTNAYKGFLEVGLGANEDQRWILSGGTEVKLLDGFYASLVTGFGDEAEDGGRLFARFSPNGAAEHRGSGPLTTRQLRRARRRSSNMLRR